MPLISLSTTHMLILLFTLAPLFQVSGALIGRRVPLRQLTINNWLFQERRWERNGKLYTKVFLVHRWKKYLPDGAKFFKGDFTKKNMLSYKSEYIEIFIAESCRAELVHWLGMIPFVIFYLLTPPLVATLMVIYAIVINMPCIITQRYNRPRFSRILEKIKKK